MKTMNRRAVLRGLGGTAIALPFLDAMMPERPARAQGGISKVGKNGRPKRFVMVKTLHGQAARWFDNQSAVDGTITKLGDVMAPMEAHGHKKDLILVDGVSDLVSMYLDNPPSAHDAWRTLTTCVPSKNQTLGGISIDQAIADQVGADTKFKSVQFAIGSPASGGTEMSATASGPLPAIFDPPKAFRLLFTDFKTDPAACVRAKARNKSILDAVRSSYDHARARIGGADKAKIEAHLDAIRELEKRVVDACAPTSGACAVPTIGATVTGPERYVTHGKIYMDLVAVAFACDLTRVAAVNWNNIDVTGGPVFSWLPGSPLWYAGHGDRNGAEMTAMSKWLVDFQAGFIDRLKAVSDGPGTVWDNTLFYWNSEIGTGNDNTYRLPALVAGSAGGYLKTNQRLVLPFKTVGFNLVNKDAPALGNLYVSFLNAMGIPATTFGAPEFCRGALAGLTA